MDRYYEVENKEAQQSGLPDGVIAFDTLEEAIEYADSNMCNLICEIGGNWDNYEKCWFCDDWFPSSELLGNGVCQRCEIAIKDHEGGNL
jgi:hypothetical protein